MNTLKAGCILALLAIVSLSERSLAQSIHATKITSPPWIPSVPLRVPVAVSAQFKNIGTAPFEPSIHLIASIYKNGAIVYRDTVIVTNWLKGESRDIRFRDFTPMIERDYMLNLSYELPSAQKAGNTQTHFFSADLESDIRTVQIVFPPKNTIIREGTTLQIQGQFDNIGLHDETAIQARVDIRRCSDKLLCFQAITAIPSIVRNDTVQLTFPSKTDSADIRNLESGCYEVAVISLHEKDVDRTNDTARTTFTLTPLNNNIRFDSTLQPRQGAFHKFSDTITPSFRFKNSGTHTQTTVQLHVRVYDPTGALVVDERKEINAWTTGQIRNVTFKSFQPMVKGYYTVKTFAVLATDEKPTDDTATITFFAGPLHDVRILASDNPKLGERKHFRNVGPLAFSCKAEQSPIAKMFDVPAKAIVSNDSGPVLVFFNGGRRLYVDSGASPLVFSEKSMEWKSINDLPIGRYTVTYILLLENDEQRSNDTLHATLAIVDTTLTYNIGAVSASSPVHNSTGPESPEPVDLTFQYINNSKNDLYDVPIVVTVTHQYKDTVRHDTVFKDFLSGEKLAVTFDPLYIPHLVGLGWYTVYAVSNLSIDVRRSDDTIVTRFARGFQRDVRTAFASMPRDHAVIPLGMAFEPAAFFDCVGIDTVVSLVPVSIAIYNCITNAIVYSASGLLPAVTPEGTVCMFPANSNGSRTQDFPPGCYKMIVTALDSLDNNLSNDQIYSRFYIEKQVSNVDAQRNSALVLDQSYPNPTADGATFGFTLPEEGVVSIRITDILGNEHEVLARTYYPSGRHSVALDLSNFQTGSYLYELTFTGQDGLVDRITKTLAIVR